MARLDPAGLDVAVDVVVLQPDHPPELIGRELALVDEPVEAAQGDPEAGRGLLGAEPRRRLVRSSNAGRFSHRGHRTGAQRRPSAPRRRPRPSRPAGRSGRSPRWARRRPAPRAPAALGPDRHHHLVGPGPVTRRAGPAPRVPGAPSAARSPKPVTSVTSGSQTRRLWAAASRATRRRRAQRWPRRARRPSAPRSARCRQRHDAVDAELGQLLDDPLGAVALGRGEGHGQTRGRRLLELHRAIDPRGR